MATPEILEQKPFSEIPDDYEPTKTEFGEGVRAVPSIQTNVPQVSDQPLQQITPVPTPPNPLGPSITLPEDPQVFTQQSKGAADDTITWNAWFWLRVIKKAILQHLNVLVSAKGGLASGQKGGESGQH